MSVPHWSLWLVLLVVIVAAGALAACSRLSAPTGQPAEGDGLPCTPYVDDGRPVRLRPVLPPLPADVSPRYRVVRVIDGDSLIIDRSGSVTIRLMGVDTPEASTAKRGTPEHYGAEATAYVTELIRLSGGRVRLTHDTIRTDRYDRELAYLWLEDGRQLNALLLAEGYGYPFLGSDPAYGDLFVALMRQARSEGRGLWQHCKPHA